MPIYALVLTSPPARPSLSEFAVRRALMHIPEQQRRAHRWLAAGEAWEAEFATNEVGGAARVRDEVAFALNGITLDVNIVVADPATRRNRLLVADMESTIVEQEFLDELAGEIGQRERIADITRRAMAGEIEFEAAIRERVGLLEGLDARVLETVYARATIMPGAEVLVRTMRRNGAHCALVSGGFSYFTERFAVRLDFDEHQANRLEISGGRLTGRVAEPILGRAAKLEALKRITERLGLQGPLTMAVGDGANDLDMIRDAGLGVAFRAKPIVAAEADAAITHGDLTALLYLQGYTREEFAAA